MKWMFPRWKSWLLALGFGLLHTPAVLSAEKQFAFKGVSLGMLIEEFRSLDFPDAGRPLFGGKSAPKAYRTSCEPIMDRIQKCWFEAWNETYPPVCGLSDDGIEQHIRKVNRTIRRPANEQLTTEGIRNMCFDRIDVGYGGRAPEFDSDITYYFHGGRLLEINIHVRPGDVDLLHPKLIIAYGPPTTESMPIEGNSFGATFQNLVVEWYGDESSIILKRYNGHTDIGQFVFVHRPTTALYEAGTVQATLDAAKDF